MPANTSQQNTKWADGLRGLASLLVVTAHITRSLAPFLLRPALEEHGGAMLFQLPILRTFVMGRPSVAAFAILAGFVNALKPIKQTRAGQIDAALAGIAKSAYRRTGRFIIPAMISTTMSWLICQFGAYALARVVDSQWIRDTSPIPSPSFAAAFTDLFRNLRTTWTTGANDYDKIQWTLCYLLRGSMLVYLTLFATAYIEPSYRYLVYLVLYFYYYTMGDAVIGINIYVGLIMAELQFSPEVHHYVERRPLTLAVLSSTFIFLGLFADSFPEDKPEWAPWSAGMITLAKYLFPKGGEVARFYPGVGAQLICVGVMFNTTAKRIFSSAWPCWLGKHSFAIYLIHAPLVRTLLTWMLFGLSSRPPSPGEDEQGRQLPRPFIPLTNRWALFVVIPVFYVILYRLAMLWVAHVDPICGQITNWIEQKIFRRDERIEKPLLQA